MPTYLNKKKKTLEKKHKGGKEKGENASVIVKSFVNGWGGWVGRGSQDTESSCVKKKGEKK